MEKVDVWNDRVSNIWRGFCDREGFVFSEMPEISIQEPDKKLFLNKLYDEEVELAIAEGRIKEYVPVKLDIRKFLPDSESMFADTGNRFEKEEIEKTPDQIEVANQIRASVEETIQRINKLANPNVNEGKIIKRKASSTEEASSIGQKPVSFKTR